MGDDEADNYQTFIAPAKSIPRSIKPSTADRDAGAAALCRASPRAKAVRGKCRLLDLRFYSLAVCRSMAAGADQAVHFVQPLIDQLSPSDNFLDKLLPSTCLFWEPMI